MQGPATGGGALPGGMLFTCHGADSPGSGERNLQLLQQIPSQQQAQNKHIDLGFVHSSACATAEAQMGTGRSVSGSHWQ